MDLDISSNLCFHDFFGYCKNHTKDFCPHGAHLKATCDIGSDCRDLVCRKQKRHPRKCKWFSLQGFCKLQDTCRFFHFSISLEILEIKAMLKANSKQFEELMNSIEHLKSISTKKAKQITKEISCEICDKDFVSKSGLTRHIKAKHSQKIPSFDIFNDNNEIDKKEANQDHNVVNKHEIESTKLDLENEIDNDETSSINIDSDDNENDIKTCLDKQYEGLSKKERQREISLAVLERFADFELRQEIKNEIEDAKYLTIPKHYKNLKNNRVFKHDEDFPPLVSTKDETLMLTFTFNEISNVEIDHLALASDDIGKIEISNYDQEKNDLYFRDPGPSDNYDTRSDVHESPECGNDNKNQENFQAAKEYVLFSHIVEKNISQYF